MAEEQQQQTTTQPEDLNLDPSFKEMIDVGLFYGRKKSRTNPKMKSYIVSNRNGIEIVNLVKTREVMDAAIAFLTEKTKMGGKVIFVGTQPAAVDDTKAAAAEFNFPIVTNRWIGGTLTNFKVISKRVEYYLKLRSNWEKNAFEKYTKKERVGIQREMRRLEELMGGLEAMVGLPDAMVVIDTNAHESAIREAKQLHIPIIAFSNTDCDPDMAEYPVVGNNKARVAVKWFLDSVTGAIREGQKMMKVIAAEKEAKRIKDEAAAVK